MAAAGRTFCVDPFCLRQFDDSSYSGTRLGPVTVPEFEAHINQLWEEGKARCSPPAGVCSPCFAILRRRRDCCWARAHVAA